MGILTRVIGQYGSEVEGWLMRRLLARQKFEQGRSNKNGSLQGDLASKGGDFTSTGTSG